MACAQTFNDFKYIDGITDIDEMPTTCTGSWVAPQIMRVRVKGKPLVWQCGYDFKAQEIVSTSCVENGTVKVSRRGVVINESKRHLGEQACLEVRRLYNDKVNKEGYMFAGKADASGALLPRSGAMEAPFPMLAKTLKHPSEITYPVYTQAKYDGIRCMSYMTSGGELKMVSRLRGDYSHLLPFFESELVAAFKTLPTGSVIDGELYIPGADFDKISSAVKSKKVISKDAANVLYFVFTTFSAMCPEPYVKRAASIRHLFKGPKIVAVADDFVESEADFTKVHAKYVESGFEGTIVYLPNGVYEQNVRSSFLLKYKDFLDAEGTIIAVKGGRGKDADAAIFDVLLDGESKSVASMRSAAPLETRRQWLLDADNLIGKRITYTFQNLTKDGIPRFPVARAIRDYE